MPRVRTTTLLKRKQEGEKITVLTAYDYPSARIMDACGMDVLMVGDSLGNNVMGLPDTLGVTMEHMLHHTAMVSRAAESALVVGDMPFMSYQVNPDEAVRNAGRFIAEAGAHAVKLEGPASRFGETIRRIIGTGIPVMGHIGLTPQSVHQIGGYKVQGRGEEAAARLKEEAMGLQEIGCFAIVLELVTVDVAAEISSMLSIPTIGIGSGAGCDGQVLIMHDILGFNEQRRFFKIFGNAREVYEQAFRAYIEEVKAGRFPAEEHGHT